MSLGQHAIRRGDEVLSRIDLVRINDRVLRAAAALMPAELRSLDAIHLATARRLKAYAVLHLDPHGDGRRGPGWRIEQPR